MIPTEPADSIESAESAAPVESALAAESAGTGTSGRPRISPAALLVLLETIQSQDLPSEVLEDEDPSVTMPRRLGLSNVVGREIRRYREEARKRRRVRDDEFRNLVHLVIRRPDADEVFRHCGTRLAGKVPEEGGWRRLLPRSLALASARRRVRRRLESLFGRRIGGFAPGAFTLEGRSLLFYQCDPGGEACHLVTGLAERVLSGYGGRAARVVHSSCQARGDELCRWTMEGETA